MGPPSSGSAAATTYAATPDGLFTAGGVWFRTTEAQLEAYAGAVLNQVPLPKLIGYAESWLHSPATLALWITPILLLVASPLFAAGLAVGVFLVWQVVGPAAVFLQVAAVMRALGHPLVQAAFFLIVLSILAAQGSMVAVGVGLALFVLLRWGLLDALAKRLLAPVWRKLYALPVPDQVLRAFIHRFALQLGCSMPELDALQRHVLDHLPRSPR